MLGENYIQGSIWRRWDLHIHTPETKKEDRFNGNTPDEKWANYVNTINTYSDEIAVVGVTDYLCTDNYFKFKRLINSKTITKPIDLILPNVELRISPVTASSTPINIHCIFNPAFEEKIERRFFQRLIFNYSGRQYNATKSDLIELGRNFKNDQSIPEENALIEGIKVYVISFNDLKKLFESDNELRNNTIVIVANGSNDGVSGLFNHYDLLEGEKFSSLEATRQDIYQFCDAIFSARKGDCDYFLGKKINDTTGNIVDDESEVKRKCGSLKPCFHGSDAHDNSKLFNPDMKRYCWVKADTTFEGLKQVIYEPAERVIIKDENPDKDFDKSLFTSIQILDNLKILNEDNSHLYFSRNNIPLNRNLISIIGGRGQGKSMLINYLGHGLNKEINPKLKNKINLSDNYLVEWKQGFEASVKSFSLGTQKDLPFTFIYQSKVKEIADDNEVLKKEIIEILDGLGFQKPLEKTNEVQVKEAVQKYWNIKEWLEKKDETDKKINDIDVLNKKIENVKENINLVTEGSNERLLKQFVLNVEEINLKRDNNSKLKELRKKLIAFKESIILELSLFDSIPQIDFSKQQKQIAILYKRNLEEILKLEKQNTQIKEDNFKEYKGDLSQLLSNLTNYQKDITDLEATIKSITDKEAEFLLAKKRLNEIIVEQLETLNEEKNAITKIWNEKIFDNPERGEAENKLIKKILADKNIKIEGTIFFNESQFYSFAEKLIDGRALKPKTKENVLNLLEIRKESISIDVLNYTIEKLEQIKIDNENCFWEGSSNDIFNILVDPSIKNKYTSIIPEITVDGKNLSELSAGQKGTVYLCLKLATQLFSGPIIFDQPEDDLDNDFITNHLIDLFKEIKKYRQVIIVSHNANLVVNSDSEQIIIANNSSEKLSYDCGSLENESINKEICRILEGGERAFEKRRDKYRYVK